MSEPFIGEIVMFGGNFAPRSWAFCDGQLLAISSNTALFSILGTTYGGDGRTTFALPDLRGRIAMHPGSGPGLPSYNLGAKGGNYQHTMITAQMPAHTHTAQGSKVAGTSFNPAGNVWAIDSGLSDKTYGPANSLGSMNSEAIANTGGGQSFSIQNPFLCVNFIIALVGIFPSRN